MSRVAVLGIDGMDSELLDRYGKELPNISRLMSMSPRVRARSVFPPDSPTAWTSIYTGLNPARHGVITFRDPKSEAKLGEHLSKNIAGTTFWDVAGRLGKRVCVVFPHMGYPVWPVNGVMVGRTNEVDIREYDIQAYPAEISEKYDLRGFEPLTSFPLDLREVIEPTKELIRREVKLGKKLFSEEEWDLFFMYFSSLDNIEHLFWMYLAGTYGKGGNGLESVIPDFYRFYDREVVGPFLDLLDGGTSLLIASDHGHGLRPVNVVNVNEVLRRDGHLAMDGGSARRPGAGGIANDLRKTMARVVNGSRVIGKVASKVISAFPGSMSLYAKALPVDLERSKAYLSDPSGGLKAYSYAGIRINRANISPEGYEGMRDAVIAAVSGITEPSTGVPLVEWACRREELYEGEHLRKYPDVLFKLRDDWGVGWDVGSDLYGTNLTHKLHSGNHRQETAVFLARFANGEHAVRDHMDLMDIAPTVLDLLGLDADVGFDGTSLVREDGR